MQLNTLFKYWTYRLFAPGVVLRETYEAFRELLVFDNRSHELMADLEALYYQGIKEDFCRISHRYDHLSDSVNGIDNADFLTGDGEVGFSVQMQSASSAYHNTLGAYNISVDGTISNVRILFSDTLAASHGATTTSERRPMAARWASS